MKISPIKRFLKLVSSYKKEARQIYGYGVLNGLINLSLPLGIQAIITYLLAGEFTYSWLILVSIVLLGILLTGILQVAQLKIVENVQQNIFAQSAFDFTYRVPKINLNEVSDKNLPELVNRFFDVVTIQKGLPKILIDFSLAIFQIFFGIILLTIYSSYFIILIFALFVVFFSIIKITGPKGMNSSIKESKYKYSLVHWLQEVARVNEGFKISGENKIHLLKTDIITGNYLNSRESHFKTLVTQFKIFIGFKFFVKAVFLVLGGYLVLEGQMNIGQFVASEILIILIINSIAKIMETTDTVYDVLTSLDKIGYIFDIPLDSNDGYKKLKDNEGLEIKAKNLTFSFNKNSKKVLNNINFKVQENEKVLITGGSGSGKSPLLRIIAGMYAPTKGNLLLNDVSIKYYQKDDLYEHYGVLLSNYTLFEGSYRENIVLGHDISEESLEETIKVLKLEPYFNKKEKGIDGLIKNGGRAVPRSVAQRILIARLIVNKPKVILMEEPFRFLSEEFKKYIVDYLTDDKRNWTAFIISDYKYLATKCTTTINLSK